MGRTEHGDCRTLILELDDGGWVGHVVGLPEIRVRGACLSEVRRRARSALAAHVEGGVELREQIRVDTPLQRRVEDVHGARSRFEEARTGLRREMVQAALTLRERGLSSRDVGALLGISQQRVSQLWQDQDDLAGTG